MEPIGSLGLQRQCFGIVAEVPGTGVAAEGSDIEVAAEEIHIVGSELDIEAVELRTVELAAVGCTFVVLGKRDSLGGQQLRRTIWHADRKLPAVPVAVEVGLADDLRRVGNLQHQPCIARCTFYHLEQCRNILP